MRSELGCARHDAGRRAGRRRPASSGPLRPFVDEHGSAPAADLDLEQEDVVDRADALVGVVWVGELLGGLPEQGMADLVERGARRGHRQLVVLA
ncbi:hypothetical protein I7412_16400 [Frankia sp. CN6]|uniref:Uncharacterized protein n=1 Tax=Frankia nepalensis TaxID=1836974 RepID=A0A937RLR0_9ACTN|nr:hypothetical protein [Frankia nepalensis]MBL7628703.1 hypothetical protein [Frankia nepalensis]